MALSEVQISNRAMQILGARFITSFTQNLKEARQCNVAYPIARDEELRRRHWNFAKRRVSLPKLTSTPPFDHDYEYSLPSDFGSIHPDFEQKMINAGKLWEVADGKLLTGHDSPVEFVYTAVGIDSSGFDSLFSKALAARIARDTASTLTDSNVKMQLADQHYRDAVAEASRANAFDKTSQTFPDDTWVTARR
jgi:hypothetical protein